MKFSTRTLYGLKAILVLAGRYGQGSLSVSQIAAKQGISAAYLEQILNALKKKGFVRSVRGPQGGYALSRKPSDTTLKDLFYTLESGGLAPPPVSSRRSTGPIAKQSKETGGGVEPLNGREKPTPESDEVAAGNFIFWKRIQLAMDKALSEMTLKELLDEARRAKRAKPRSNYTFHI